MYYRMSKKEIQKVISWKIPFKIRIIQFLVILKKRIKILERWKFKWLKNVEWLKNYDISANLFSPKNRKNWISWFARLRNWWEFLEQVIESHIPYLDEIILVDNNSDDNTREICEKMQKKYPKIIKIVKYEPEVYKLWTKEYSEVSENSVHDMSYYYNRVLSKTTYKYAIKIDDDHIVIPEVLKILTNSIRKNWLNKFVSVWLYNVIQKWDDLYLPVNAPFAWLYWDFWFFPVSENTYFVKDKLCENFIHNLRTKYWWLWFFHLKFFKNNWWIVNYEWRVKESILAQSEWELYILPQNIKNLFFSLFKN